MTQRAEIERLVADLREPTGGFVNATYKALQAGTATKHQQQAAASGMILERARYARAADALSGLIKREKAVDAEIAAGIAGTTSALKDAEGDLFWSRYWSGYLKAYEDLRGRLAAMNPKTEGE